MNFRLQLADKAHQPRNSAMRVCACAFFMGTVNINICTEKYVCIVRGFGYRRKEPVTDAERERESERTRDRFLRNPTRV